MWKGNKVMARFEDYTISHRENRQDTKFFNSKRIQGFKDKKKGRHSVPPHCGFTQNKFSY